MMASRSSSCLASIGVSVIAWIRLEAEVEVGKDLVAFQDRFFVGPGRTARRAGDNVFGRPKVDGGGAEFGADQCTNREQVVSIHIDRVVIERARCIVTD